MRCKFILCILVACEILVANAQSVNSSCSNECVQPPSRFCFSQRDERTCECPVICCSLPYCDSGIDWNRCVSCYECPCLNSTDSLSSSSLESTQETTETTIQTTPFDNCSLPCPPSDDKFCYNMKDDKCRCQKVCCAPPFCKDSEVDWKNCVSCDHCPCLPVTSVLSNPLPSPSKDCSAPCPKSASNFCTGVRDDKCECQEVCCSPPLCEGSIVDWDRCVSCDQCPCKPVTFPSPSPSPIQPYCKVSCRRRKGCKVDVNVKTCSCVYRCRKY